MDVSEDENVTFLTSTMGNEDPEIARQVLRKHNGDLQKAATSILEGDTAEDSWPTDFDNLIDVLATVTDPSTLPRKRNDVLPPMRTHMPLIASKPERDKGIIDLTGDDENSKLRRALEASLSTFAYEPSGSQLRPSQRAPDPNWDMVLSNARLS